MKKYLPVFSIILIISIFAFMPRQSNKKQVINNKTIINNNANVETLSAKTSRPTSTPMPAPTSTQPIKQMRILKIETGGLREASEASFLIPKDLQ